MADASSPSPRAPGAFWLKAGAAFALALAVVVVVPRAGEADGTAPPVGTLLLAAALVAAVTTVALYLGLTRDLRLPVAVALYAVGYNALIVAVKFVLGPHGLYEVNQSANLTSFLSLEDEFGATLAALFVLLLYAAAYTGIYLLVRQRVAGLRPPESERAPPSLRLLLLFVLGGAVLVAATGGGLLLLVFLFLETGIEYLEFVFSSGVSLLVGLTLAGAAALAALALRSTAERARLAGDAAVLVSLFFVGLAFLALYHALWVVYVLVLTALWPLRVVVPK